MNQSVVDMLAWSRDLYAISQKSRGQDDAMERILHHVIAGFDADGGYLALSADGPRGLRVVASHNYPHAEVGRLLGVTEALDPSAQGMKASVTNHPASDRDGLFRNDERHIFLPLLADGRITGMLLVHRRNRDLAFKSADFERGSIMTSLLSMAIDTQRLQADQHRRIEELSRVNAEFRIINERLESAQNQLIQSEKMASLGQLAAGVAHEINNPIGYVHSNLGTLEGYVTDLFRLVDGYAKAAEQPGAEALLRETRALRETLDVDFLRDDVRALLAEVHEGITRVRKIVQELKDFSHAGTGDAWTPADLHKGLDSTLSIVNSEIKYRAEVVRDYGDIPQLLCQPSQLNQVFLNLLVNAAHAIEKNGRITIRTRIENDIITVSISDTGHGIKPEHLTRIFDPFFTTKPVGKGTGLGLSLSYGIVKNHGGTIEVESVPGAGTTFHVRLPVNPVPAVSEDTEVTPHA